MSHIEKSVYVDKALSFAQGLAFRYHHEFITPEHILSALFNQDPFVEAVEECFCHIPVIIPGTENGTGAGRCQL